jgi:hypothetical protein
MVDGMSSSSHRVFKFLASGICSFSLACTIATVAQGQTGVPLPGQAQLTEQNNTTAPLPGAETGAGANAGGSALTGISQYQQLPMSVSDARGRLQELRLMVQATRPADLQQNVSRFSEWLADIIDAHNKLANTFAKYDNMKSQAQMERQTAIKFAQIRNQAQLLKADLLIRQHRNPEALSPLIDIVIAEPNTATGQSAYKKLKELGFSEEAPIATEAEVPAEAKDAVDSNVTTLPSAKSQVVKSISVAQAKISPTKAASMPGPARKAVAKTARVTTSPAKKSAVKVTPASAPKL